MPHLRERHNFHGDDSYVARVVQKPRPNERLWTLRKGAAEVSCELRYHGEDGVEAHIYRQGDFFYGHRFDTRAQATAFAEEERADWMAEGFRQERGLAGGYLR